MKVSGGILLLFLSLASRRAAFGFRSITTTTMRRTTTSSSTSLDMAAAGQGFGGGNNKEASGSSRQVATYGKAQKPIKDLIDTEAAMKEFFSTNEEWTPLFQSLANSHEEEVMAMPYLGATPNDFEITFDITNLEEQQRPWKLYPQQPTDEEERKVLGRFFDAMQQSLIDIPVNEAVKEDEDDLHFLEEGRRMLAISRFHVLTENAGGSVENYESLFTLVWSELAYLSQSDEINTGSLILLPQYDYTDLKRFTDMNLLRPLDWLGMSGHVEVASMELESPAIRLLHKLADMPTEPYDGEEDE